MKQLIDLLPILVFVVIYVLGDIYTATAGLMATAILQIIIFKFNGWEISRQLWIVFA
ncbi:MAG: septation protein A, partial [Gammaproteobacteria bacterium]|nr:septation protein A [Gammaproteobacteria bacterium]